LAFYERLGAQDSSFLYFEAPGSPMHVAGVAVFDTGDLATELGGVDVGRLTKYIEAQASTLPHYRQKLAITPVDGQPVWVDDAAFELANHVRHTSLPAPGSESQLKAVAGRILSQHLDRRRPLWEMWIVEGLEDGRFALISKIHHCMIDGASGVNLMTLLFRPEPVSDVPASPAWTPRSTPSGWRLMLDQAARRAAVPLGLLRDATRALSDPQPLLESLEKTARSLGSAFETVRHLASPSPLNGETGPHRLVEWCSFELEDVRGVAKRRGVKINDVILATVAGALRRFLQQRKTDLDGLDFRVAVPVNMRPAGDDSSAGNHVSAMLMSLPLAEPDPLRRLALIRSETRRQKESGAALGPELLFSFGDWSGSSRWTQAVVGLINWMRPHNLVVTNVPGPPFPLYMLGARLRAMYPQLPLLPNQGLGIAVLSYDGHVNCGLIGDWELVPDIESLTASFKTAFEELQSAA
jgi:WS/DGAT/MGAT family acyltransferase